MEARHENIPQAARAARRPRGAALICAMLLAGLLAGPAAAAQVYRWVDENGEVHYSESLPPDYKDQGHDVLSGDGRVIDENVKLTPQAAPLEKKSEADKLVEEQQELPRDSSGLPRPKPLYSKEETQRRMDNFLMLRYDSEQEILDAMSVEIKQLNYDRRLLEGSRASFNEAYRGQVRLAAERQRAGLEVEDKTAREIRDLRTALAKNDRSLQGLQVRENNIREDFEKQLERYRYLVETWSDETSGN
jgi:hypothetical protein